MSKNNNSLSGLIDTTCKGLRARKISLKTIFEKLESRGFGAFLTVFSLIIILPTGAIPLVPAICAFCIVFICTQILYGRESLWLPNFLNKIEINSKKFKHHLTKAKSVTTKIDKVFHKRLLFFFTKTSKLIISSVCIILSMCIIAVGFIPTLPTIFSFPILLFGISYITNDGLIIAISLGFILFGAIFSFAF